MGAGKAVGGGRNSGMDGVHGHVAAVVMVQVWSFGLDFFPRFLAWLKFLKYVSIQVLRTWSICKEGKWGR